MKESDWTGDVRVTLTGEGVPEWAEDVGMFDRPPMDWNKRFGDLGAVHVHRVLYTTGVEATIEMKLLFDKRIVGSVEAVLLATRALIELPAQVELRKAHIVVEAEYRKPTPPIVEQVGDSRRCPSGLADDGD